MNIKTNNYPHLPPITGNNKERVFTKHWANLPLHINPNEMAILSFLAYQAKADNTFKYSVELLQRYVKAVRYANDEYNPSGKKRLRMPNGLATTPGFIKLFMDLMIDHGWLLSTTVKNVYMINPMLTYVPYYVGKEQYKEMCLLYKARPADVVEYFKGIVNGKVNSKKGKNAHIFWQG